MEFFKNKLGLAAIIVSFGILLAVLWFCLFGNSGENTKDGTLVQAVPYQREVSICRQAV